MLRKTLSNFKVFRWGFRSIENTVLVVLFIPWSDDLEAAD